MSRETTLAGKLDDLGRLVAALFAHAAELPQLEGVRLHLEQLLKARPPLGSVMAVVARLISVSGLSQDQCSIFTNPSLPSWKSSHGFRW